MKKPNCICSRKIIYATERGHVTERLKDKSVFLSFFYFQMNFFLNVDILKCRKSSPILKGAKLKQSNLGGIYFQVYQENVPRLG